MSFAADVALGLAEGRALAEARMTLTAIVRRPTGEVVPDPATDSDVPVLEPVLSSKCRLTEVDAQPMESEVGARTVVEVRQRIDFPVGIADLRPGDVVSIDSAPSEDAQVVGLSFELVASPTGSQKTAARWPVRRYQS